MLKRVGLFLATNLAVLIIASITLKLLGVDRFTGQNYGSLLVFCAVFGFAGSLVSLFISKWMAKMSTGTQIITQPQTRHEQWLLQTVEQLSREAGIKVPEVGIFPAYESNAFATGWNKNDALVGRVVSDLWVAAGHSSGISDISQLRPPQRPEHRAGSREAGAFGGRSIRRGVSHYPAEWRDAIYPLDRGGYSEQRWGAGSIGRRRAGHH